MTGEAPQHVSKSSSLQLSTGLGPWQAMRWFTNRSKPSSFPRLASVYLSLPHSQSLRHAEHVKDTKRAPTPKLVTAIATLCPDESMSGSCCKHRWVRADYSHLDAASMYRTPIGGRKNIEAPHNVTSHTPALQQRRKYSESILSEITPRIRFSFLGDRTPCYQDSHAPCKRFHRIIRAHGHARFSRSKCDKHWSSPFNDSSTSAKQLG